MDDYKDIIDLPHHTSKTRPRMSIEARSAQFAPFSALTGYDEAVKEAGRRTNSKIEIDDFAYMTGPAVKICEGSLEV